LDFLLLGLFFPFPDLLRVLEPAVF